MAIEVRAYARLASGLTSVVLPNQAHQTTAVHLCLLNGKEEYAEWLPSS